MSWLYVLLVGLAILGWLVLLSGLGLLAVLSWRNNHDNGSANAAATPAPAAMPDDPLPRRTHPSVWVPYGTRGHWVHRRCAANRQDACTSCAPVVGRPVAPRQP